jgi:hypothetical protein
MATNIERTWFHVSIYPRRRDISSRIINIKNIINLFNMQMREVIWKWDVLDSSKDYLLLMKSKDLISNYPAIWQKLSSIENIINLINYANGWRNLKTKCMLHNNSLCSMDLCRNHLNPSSSFKGVARKRNSAPILPWNNMQTREVIWKWDVLDSSKDYPLLNSEDFIPNYPAFWQKWSNIENIINLTNYANEWCNLKTKCMLHNYSLYSMDLWRNHLNPFSGFGGVARKRNSAPILPWNNGAHP